MSANKQETLRRKNHELKEKLSTIERMFQQSDSDNQKMTGQLRELEKANEHFKVQAHNMQRELEMKTITLQELIKPNKAFPPDKADLEQTRRAGNFLEHELRQKEDEIGKLKQLLEDRTHQMAVYKVISEQEWDKQQSSNMKFNEQNMEIEQLKTENQQLKQKLELITSQLNQQSCSSIEIQHLRNDNTKLLKMLQQTKEHQQFAQFQDQDISRLRQLTTIKSKKKDDTHKTQDDKQLWVPEKAFQFALAFKEKYDTTGAFSEELIELLLFELNKIWQRKNDSELSRMRRNCKSQISGLKSSKDSSVSLLEKDNLSTIERLKKQVRDLQKENRELFSKRPSREPQGVDSLLKGDQSRSVQYEMRQKDDQIKKLSLELDGIKNNLHKKENEKQMYCDGALWMNRQIHEEISKVPDQNAQDQLNQVINKLRKQIQTTQQFL